MRVGAASYRAHENEMTSTPQFIDPHHNMWAGGPQCVLVFEFSRCKRPVSANRKIESIYGHAAPLGGRPSKSSRGERYYIRTLYNLCVIQSVCQKSLQGAANRALTPRASAFARTGVLAGLWTGHRRTPRSKVVNAQSFERTRPPIGAGGLHSLRVDAFPVLQSWWCLYSRVG
jgi:hypothetical protein